MPRRMSLNARLVKQAGGEYVIAALVFTLSPIHDDAHYAERARTLAASPDIDALYIKDPGGLLSQKRAATLIPAIKARHAAAKPLELHSHNTIGLAEHDLHGCAGSRRQRAAMRLGRRRGRHLESARRAHRRQPARARAIASTSTTRRWPRCPTTSRSSPRPRDCRPGGRRASTPPTCITSCPAARSAPCAGIWPRAACRISKAR